MTPFKLFDMLAGKTNDYFTHLNSPLAADISKGKVMLMLAFSGIGIVVSLGYWVLHPILEFNVPRSLFLVFAATLAALCLLLRTSIPYRWLAQALLFSFWFSFAFGAYFSGGIYSITIPWLTLVPVLANFIDNSQSSLAWFAMCCLTILVFTFFPALVPVVQHVEGPWRHTLSMTGLCFVLFLLTNLFVKSRNTILNTVHTTNNQLLSQQKKIIEQNQQSECGDPFAIGND